MDDNPEQQLTEKIKHCLVTVGRLLEEYESLILKQKSTDTTGDFDYSVKQIPIVNYLTKQLMDIDLDLVLESNQQQLKLALKKYLRTQSDLPTSEDRPMIQSNTDQMEVVKVTINQQVELSDDSNGRNEGKLNPTVQALFTGTLPDDVYLHLLSFMGIQECLLSNRLVCLFWNELVLERCNNQKSLKLFENFDCLMNYGELLLNYEKTENTSLILKSIGDDLLFEGLETDHEELFQRLNLEKKLEASKVLTTFFPKIYELVLCVSECYTHINIEHLLQFYAEQLTSLTMTHYGFLFEDPGSKLRAFAFPKLKSLNTFHFAPEDEQLLSLLPQLESLTLPGSSIRLETLLRTGTQLGELNIDTIHSVYTSPAADFSKRPPINSNLRKFSFEYSQNVLQVLEFISLNLTSLECLKLECCNQNNFPRDASHLNSLTPYLVPLHKLHSLTLAARVSFFLLDGNQLAEIQPLPSVRQLKLHLFVNAPLSMDRFSRALFKAFPKVEQILMAFVGCEEYDDDLVGVRFVDTHTFAAFEDFASKHPNVVQLFRSKDMSKFSKLPNAVSPLFGHHRQVYEEYIEEEELFGVAIGKLTACLVAQEGEQDGPNLKTVLRPADQLTAMSNLLRLLESKAFAFTCERVYAIIAQMVDCALTYDSSQIALFTVTCQCVLFLLDCRVVNYDSNNDAPFLYSYDLDVYSGNLTVYSLFEMMRKLVEHFEAQQLDDKAFLLQLWKRMVKLLKEFDSFRNDWRVDDFEMFKILLELVDQYKSERLNVLYSTEKLLLQMRHLIDDQLLNLDDDRLDSGIRELIRSGDPVYRVEMVRALTRCGELKDSYVKLLNGEDSDSSDSTSGGSSSSAESEL